MRESGALRRATSPHPRARWLIALVAVAVVAAHAVGVWYGNSFSLSSEVKPKKNTLAIEIVRPPKPEPIVEAAASAAEEITAAGAAADPERRRCE